MEIVKHGTKDIVQCNTCGSELRWSLSDVHTHNVEVLSYYDEIEPEDLHKTFVQCPVCKHTVYVQCTRAQKRLVLELECRANHDL